MYTPSEMRSLVMAAGFENVVHLDAPRELLGRSIVARAAMRAALRLTGWDWLSATANCQASKPDGGQDRGQNCGYDRGWGHGETRMPYRAASSAPGQAALYS